MIPKKRKTQAEEILRISAKSGFILARDIESWGIHHETLRRLCGKGLLKKMGRGLYTH